MQAANTKSQILEQVRLNTQVTHDQEAKVGELCYLEDGYSWCQQHEGEEEKLQLLHMSSHAEGQLLQRLGIPIAYIHRCPFTLAKRNLDYWLHHYTDKDIKFRLVDGEKGTRCRAVVTPRYVPMDDKDVIPEILDQLGALAQNDDISFGYLTTDDFSILRAYYSHLEVRRGDLTLRALITISNSETGMAALIIRPTILIPTYPWHHFPDLHISDSRREGLTSIRHLKEFSAGRVQDAVKRAYEAAQVGLARALALDEVKVSNPFEAIESLVHHNNLLPKKILVLLEDEWREKQEASKLQIGAAILDCLQNLPLFTKHQVECEVGRYLNLFADSRKRLGKALAGIALTEDNTETVEDNIQETVNNLPENNTSSSLEEETEEFQEEL